MRYIVFPNNTIRILPKREEDDVARGTTGAPRNTPGTSPGVPADGGDTGTVGDTGTLQRQDTRNSRAPGFGDPGAGPDQSRSGGLGRLIAFVCGRRSKYLSGGILVVLVIGASTDYALLLIARYREELRRHSDRHQAMAVALRRAGPAIIASGLTVVTGMLCLLAAQSNDISGLGPVAAIGIAVGLIAMITLLPALLVVFGRWIFWPVRPGYGSAEPTSRGLWSRVGQAIGRRPRAVWLVTQSCDYNIFLMTRVREESARSGTRRGAITGLAATGGVITSAGLVLAATFAVLGTLPLVEFTEIGFAVALGVLLDTIIVRSVLVTALTLDIGRHIWWPSALANPEGSPVTDGT